MTNGARIFIIHGDDWSVMYVNGKMHTQGHRIEIMDIVEVVNDYSVFEEATENWLNKDGLAWLENRGRFPVKLSEIPIEYFGG